MSDICFISIYEAAGFDDWLDWVYSLAEPIECTHAEHWDGYRDKNWLDWDDPPAVCRLAQVYAVCDLEEEHDGPHRFVPEDEIRLEFVAA